MTGRQFDALPYEDGRLLELLEGELVPVSGPTLEHQEIVFRILMALKQHLSNTGAIVSHDVEFALTPDTRLRPDVWVVLASRAAGINPSIARSRVVPTSPSWSFLRVSMPPTVCARWPPVLTTACRKSGRFTPK
jgi:hypothetical protein